METLVRHGCAAGSLVDDIATAVYQYAIAIRKTTDSGQAYHKDSSRFSMARHFGRASSHSQFHRDGWLLDAL